MEITRRERDALGMPTKREVAEIAARLKAARMAINPNQAEFATRAGLTQNRYNQYETGSRPLTIDAALKLRDTYGLTLDYLYRGDAALIPHGLMERLQPRPEADPQK